MAVDVLPREQSPRGWWRVHRHRPSGLPSAVQELSRAKAMALSERGQAEEELIKAKNQVRLEEVSPPP